VAVLSGTGATCHLAASLNRKGVRLGGVVLQSPYTSIKGGWLFLLLWSLSAGALRSLLILWRALRLRCADVVKSVAGSLVGGVIGNRWSNVTEIKEMTDPVFFVHGQRDTLIPWQHSQVFTPVLRRHCLRMITSVCCSPRVLAAMQPVSVDIACFAADSV
jgi:hypothetical protein